MLKEYLGNWLMDNGWDEISIIQDKEWYYDDMNTAIAYTLGRDFVVEETFNEYAKSIGLKYQVDPFVLSFLHELGHYETLCIVEDEDRLYDEVVKLSLNKENHTREDYFTYYSLTTEWFATSWAVEFINSNYEIIKNFEKVVLNLLTDC